VSNNVISGPLNFGKCRRRPVVSPSLCYSVGEFGLVCGLRINRWKRSKAGKIKREAISDFGAHAMTDMSDSETHFSFEYILSFWG
jgi:hypothetical protein